jgi:hypothetical protein
MAQTIAGPSKRWPFFEPSLVLMRSVVNKVVPGRFLSQYCAWVSYIITIQPKLVFADSYITDAEIFKRNNLKIRTI